MLLKLLTNVRLVCTSSENHKIFFLNIKGSSVLQWQEINGDIFYYYVIVRVTHSVQVY